MGSCASVLCGGKDRTSDDAGDVEFKRLQDVMPAADKAGGGNGATSSIATRQKPKQQNMFKKQQVQQQTQQQKAAAAAASSSLSSSPRGPVKLHGTIRKMMRPALSIAVHGGEAQLLHTSPLPEPSPVSVSAASSSSVSQSASASMMRMPHDAPARGIVVLGYENDSTLLQ
jgi:hypothetical protein